MSTGLLALLDDIAAIAKVAAATLDDMAGQAAKAGSKATGIVIDDAAVTPRYVVGFAADRELPIIGRIALGSLKSKMLVLLPASLALSVAAPWAITPLLMAGGAYLCLEGFHKVADMAGHGHGGEPDETPTLPAPTTSKEAEDQRVASAIRTDFILSAEIMAITLSTVATAPLWMRGGVLAVVGVFMTALVYGAVAIIVRADDWGAWLARTKTGALAAFGRAVVKGMPAFLKALSLIGMLAMLWVGGGIVLHGAYELGLKGPETIVKAAARWAEGVAPFGKGVIGWLTGAALAGVAGLAIGAVSAIVEKTAKPAILGLLRGRTKAPAATAPAAPSEDDAGLAGEQKPSS